MAQNDMQQIEEKLNQLFVDFGPRKIIFWFDPSQEFLEGVDSLKLGHAKLYYLEENTQFKAKRELEYIYPETNFLVYAPFTRWSNEDEDNHMLSVLKYSDEFQADRLAMIMNELHIPMRFHDVVTQYSQFLNAKDRIKRFADFNLNINSVEQIELTIMAVLAKTNSNRLNNILQEVFQQFTNGDQSFFKEIEKYNLTSRFWELINLKFDFSNDEPTLEKLAISLYLNYFYYQIDQEIPKKFKEFEVRYLRNNIITFMDQFMNDNRFATSFDRLSKEVFKAIKGEQLIENTKIDHLMDADVFSDIHRKILTFYSERLASGDTTTKIAGRSIYEGLKYREKMHFAASYRYEYQLLKHASYLVDDTRWQFTAENSSFLAQYEKEFFWIDTHYRKFISNLDKIENSQDYVSLIRLVERNYLKFLDRSGQVWNQNLDFGERPSIRNFYEQAVINRSVKTLVIISDAFRFELGKNLQRKFEKEKKFSSDMKGYFSVLPSVTEFGKAALLPNNQLTYTEGIDVLVDGKKTNGLVNRLAILQQKNSQATAINYADLYNMNKNEMREFSNGKNVIYVYHDQIDKQGDHGGEKQVFDAANQAIEEIFQLVKRVQNDIRINRFVVTADHGFIYHRGKVEEADKIDNPSTDDQDRVERRFILSKNSYAEVGITNYSLGESLGNDDSRVVNVPLTSSIFKKAGGGQNYVHGGSSVQEMLVPVVEITSSRGNNAKEPVPIELTTTNRKITGLSTTLEFYQKYLINDLYDPTMLRLYFEDESGERISNEVAYVADSKQENANERFSKFIFEFLNRRYDVTENYYLVLENSQTNIAERIKFIIDNPFAVEFNFDL